MDAEKALAEKLNRISESARKREVRAARLAWRALQGYVVAAIDFMPAKKFLKRLLMHACTWAPSRNAGSIYIPWLLSAPASHTRHGAEGNAAHSGTHTTRRSHIACLRVCELVRLAMYMQNDLISLEQASQTRQRQEQEARLRELKKSHQLAAEHTAQQVRRSRSTTV